MRLLQIITLFMNETDFQKTVLESLQKLDQKTDRLEKKLEEHDEKFVGIEKKLEEHDQNFSPLIFRFLPENLRATAIVLFPLIYPITLETAYFGGFWISMRTWLNYVPFNNLTSLLQGQFSELKAEKFSHFAVKAFFLYSTKTTW